MGRVKKKRKPRGIKQDGTRSKDFCTGCWSLGCTSYGGKVQEKLRSRIDRGLCPACGAEECICKSDSPKLVKDLKPRDHRVYDPDPSLSE